MIDEQRLQEVGAQDGVDIHEEGPRGEDDIDSVDISVGGDFLDESENIAGVPGTSRGLGNRNLDGTHDLASAEDEEIGVVVGNFGTVGEDLAVEGLASSDSPGVFGTRKEVS